jgi:hypothetical protein
VTTATVPKPRLKSWLLEKVGESDKKEIQQGHWLNVMCLTGVDYFSSLGFAPAMAALAAGILSPFATLLLVFLNLFGAFPMYAKVAEMSPHGQGSISLLQDYLPRWWGKLLIIALLGFAATGFIMTITLCSSDAAKHLVENPLAPSWLKNQLGLTLFLVVLLGAMFLKGLGDVIGLAVCLVWSYLGLTAIVIGYCAWIILGSPDKIVQWHNALLTTYPTWWQMAGVAALAFPKLALGMSGFETGVAVMPHVRGDASDTEVNPEGRIRHTKHLLLTAAIIMSMFLLASSIVTTLLVPQAEFAENGQANGRALAYLAHEYLGDTFATVYDISTILILWFAGSSAMAGLLNLIPHYLPKYGMAPNWVSSSRPLVLLLTGICIIVVMHFRADVDAQAGAFATGLLVLMTSAALAATIAVWNNQNLQRWLFISIFLVFMYTTGNNIVSRPDGIKIAGVFILCIVVTSFLSRCIRSTELRIKQVVIDATAQRFLQECAREHLGEIRFLAHRPDGSSYAEKISEARYAHSIQKAEGNFIFLEVSPNDPSNFVENTLTVRGVEKEGYKIWQCSSLSVPNAIAAILLKVRDETHKIPHAYFGWTEGNPISYVFKYILFGEGETAPLTREILRSVERNTKTRPRIHVS